VRSRAPGVRAALVAVLGVVAGVSANLATNGFSLVRWRWWLVGGVAGLGLLAAAEEFLRARAAARRGDEPTDVRLAGPVEVVIRTPTQVATAAWRVPWMVPPVGASSVPRPQLAGDVLNLLRGPGGGTVGVTTALHGAGGFGKTTLAAQVCATDEVRDRFPGGLLWATVGEERRGAELAAVLCDLCEQVTGERPGLSDPEQAGYQLGQVMDGRAMLLVVDDVWSADQLRPFLLGGPGVARLVTTRIAGVLPGDAATVRVDEMAVDESRLLLCASVPGVPGERVGQLLRLTGRWPLLLALVNAALRRAVRDGAALDAVCDEVVALLAEAGPATLDVTVAGRRSQAVRATVTASLRWLDVEDRQRYLQLGIFAEDADIALDALGLLWRLPVGRVTQLCAELDELSLLAAFRRDRRTVRLHDVLRGFARHECEADLPAVNRRFVDAARGLGAVYGWWQLPAGADYLWRQLCYHLAEAGLVDDLAATACDLRWIQPKILRYGVAAVEADLARVENHSVAAALRAVLSRQGHLLGPIHPEHSHADVLCSRLASSSELTHQVAQFTAHLPADVRISNRWPLPDAGHAQRRALTGHTGPVDGCAIAPDGTWLATTGADKTARLWDVTTGQCTATLTGHTDWVNGCAIAPDGTWLATASDDKTARLWDVATGQCTATLTDHTGWVTDCAIGPNGAWLATTSTDRTVRLWDVAARQCTAALTGHTGWVIGCAIAPDGTWLATASRDKTVRLWDVATGQCTATLTGHTNWVTDCAIGPNGAWLATTGADWTVRLWDVATGQCTATLTGHTGWVIGCAIAPDGARLATTSRDGTVRLWDVLTGSPIAAMRVAGPLTTTVWLPDISGICVTGAAGVYVFAVTAPQA
jgi:WD40 repeat protein